MPDTLQIMVLPTTVAEGLPQVFFDDCGIWRETSSLPLLPLAQNALRQEIEAFLSNVMKQVGQTPPTPFPAGAMAFRNPFTVLLRTLLPLEVRNAMKRSADEAEQAQSTRPQLNIFFRGSTEWIPWELLHDGTNYVGVRYAVSRLPIMLQATQIRPPRDQVVRKVYNLLAKDILQDPDLADWQSTFAPYAQNPDWECRFPANSAANYPTLAQLDDAKGADVVHITCHGGIKEASQGGYFWTLDHQNPNYFDYRITTGVAQAAEFSQRPLVFGNACVSAAAQPTTDLTALQGFGGSFMVGGALNFVGTFAPITKTMAVTFAKRFYARLFGTPGQPAMPIGEALRVTKESFAAENCPDPSYLFYCLYGPCDSTYKP